MGGAAADADVQGGNPDGDVVTVPLMSCQLRSVRFEQAGCVELLGAPWPASVELRGERGRGGHIYLQC